MWTAVSWFVMVGARVAGPFVMTMHALERHRHPSFVFQLQADVVLAREVSFSAIVALSLLGRCQKLSGFTHFPLIVGVVSIEGASLNHAHGPLFCVQLWWTEITVGIGFGILGPSYAL